jgi:hypothetical protein
MARGRAGALPKMKKNEKILTEALSHGEEGKAADYTNLREKGLS